MNNYARLFIVSVSLLLLGILLYIAKPFLSKVFVFLGKIILPFLIALLISYVLYPIVKFLVERLNMHRTSAIFVLFLFFGSLLAMLIYYGTPVFIMEIEELMAQLPDLLIFYESMSRSFYQSLSFLPESLHPPLDSLMFNLERKVEGWLEQSLERFFSFFNHFFRLLMLPVLVFYMLKDEERVRQFGYRLIPTPYKKVLQRLFDDIHEAFGAYIRGQFLLSSFITLLSLVLFKIIDLKYAFLLSVFMGVMNIIPYFGPIIGTIPAVFIAMASSWQLVIYVILIAIVVQIIESSLLSPYIMGKTANLHPIVIILLLLISSEIGGILAMLLAIPLAMVLRAAVLSLLRQKGECIDN